MAICCAVGFACASGSVCAQTPQFEVISIRPTPAGEHESSSWRTSPSGDITVHSDPLIAFIMGAYGVDDYQVSGYPAWVVQDDWDIAAKVGADKGGSRPKELQMRLQALLAERCKLVVRHGVKKVRPQMVVPDDSTGRSPGPDGCDS